MEYKLRQMIPDIPKFESIMDHLMIMYSQDPQLFYKTFKVLDKGTIKIFKYLSSIDDTDTAGDFVEVIDCAKEVYFYFTSYKEMLKVKKEEALNNFTLRNSDDLITFEFFLDKMETLHNASPNHFIDIFPRCPVVFWDKIDDLRETSYKDERDSEEYTRCLLKCKSLSFKFSELSGSNTSGHE